MDAEVGEEMVLLLVFGDRAEVRLVNVLVRVGEEVLIEGGCGGGAMDAGLLSWLRIGVLAAELC